MSGPSADEAAVDRALAASAAALADMSPTGSAHQLGAVTLSLSGVPDPNMNFLVVHGTVRDPQVDVGPALHAADGTGTGYTLVVRDPSAELRAYLEAQGLTGGDGSEPGMLLELHDRPVVPPDLAVERCAGAGASELFFTLMGEVFGLDPTAANAAFGGDMAGHEPVAAYLGYLGSMVVGMSMGVTRDGVVAIFNVGVTIDHRRRGFGQALTWAAIAGGWDAGARRSILLASELGAPVYRRMGFRDVGRYYGYLRPTGAGPWA